MVGQGNHPMQKMSRDDGAEVLRWSQLSACMTYIHTSFETCGRVRGSVSRPSDGLGVRAMGRMDVHRGARRVNNNAERRGIPVRMPVEPAEPFGCRCIESRCRFCLRGF